MKKKWVKKEQRLKLPFTNNAEQMAQYLVAERMRTEGKARNVTWRVVRSEDSLKAEIILKYELYEEAKKKYTYGRHQRLRRWMIGVEMRDL